MELLHDCQRVTNQNVSKKNWRPISLLNTVYKIASGSIANKIKNVWIRYPKMTKQDLYEGEI